MSNAAITQPQRQWGRFIAAGVELRAYFREFESQIGFRSSWGAQTAEKDKVGLKTPSSRQCDDAIAELIDSSRLASGRAVWRALRELDQRGDVAALVVLYRLYGFEKVDRIESKSLGCSVRKCGDFGKFGEDAVALATLTDAAEEAREELAIRWGEERGSGVVVRAEAAHEESRTELAEEFWEAVGRENLYAGRTERMLAKLASTGEALWQNKAAEASEHATAWRDVQRSVLHAYRIDGRLSAKLSCLAQADRGTTLEEAIAWRLADPEERLAFVAAVRRDADRLKVRAHEAYRDAKRAAERS